jgi:hypothetical protein
MKKVLVSFFVLLASHFYSQVNTDVKIKEIASKKISVEFTCSSETHAVVVMVSDSSGTTLFMDNRFRFKGPYKWDVDLKKQPRGSYTLDVIRDDNKYSTTFTLK